MNKEKEIEEMANAISKSCEEQIEKNRCASLRCEMCMAEFMIEAGYRKADEVAHEAIKKVFYELFCSVKEVGDFIITPSDIIERAQMYGITIEEVDE